MYLYVRAVNVREGVTPAILIDDSPENESFSGFHHPVNFRSHLTSLRNRTKPTGTGA